jgi:hypothetical protein
MDVNVAVSIDLMTHSGTIEAGAIKHICLVGNTRLMVQGAFGAMGMPSSPRNGFAVAAGKAAIGRVSKNDVHLNGSRRAPEKVVQDAECRRTRTLRPPYRAA